MANRKEERTAELRLVVDALEQERDKIYDQVANLQGHKERLDWTIKGILTRIDRIEKEEDQFEKEEAEKDKLAKEQNEALVAARERGNVGVHPSQRKTSLVDRRKAAIAESEIEIEQVKEVAAKPKKKARRKKKDK